MTSLPIRLRLGALVLIAIALAAPFTASAGTSITCADFNNPDAAQHLLDVDDSYADALDEDGDGIACNANAAEQGEFIANPTTADIGEYMDAVMAHTNELITSVNDFASFLEDPEGLGPHTDEMVEIIALWRDAPARAAALDYPAGMGDVQEAYLAATDAYHEAYLAFAALDAANDAGEDTDAAYDEFAEAMDLVIEQTGYLQDALRAVGR